MPEAQNMSEYMPECLKECQNVKRDCQKTQEFMPDVMPGRTSEDMPESAGKYSGSQIERLKGFQKNVRICQSCQKECQKICQIEGRKHEKKVKTYAQNYVKLACAGGPPGWDDLHTFDSCCLGVSESLQTLRVIFGPLLRVLFCGCVLAGALRVHISLFSKKITTVVSNYIYIYTQVI